MRDGSIRGTSAIVGAAWSGLGEAHGMEPLEMIAHASRTALQDAGLGLQDVDGLFGCMQVDFFSTMAVAEYLGIRPTFSDNNRLGGSSFLMHTLQAALALEAGLCKVALIFYGSNQRTAMGKLQSAVQGAWTAFESRYGPRFPISSYALAASRHMHEYGTTPEQLAEVAVAARRWAQLHPDAFVRDPLTIADVLSAPRVSTPFGRLDCCLVTDGAGAIVMTAADRAKDLPRPPVYLLGAAGAHWHKHISEMPDLTVTAAAESAPKAFAMAGVRPADVDVVQIYDAFTINTIVLLEDLGFCPKGEGGRFVENGAIAPGGRLAVNTSGGGLSFCHPGMLGLFLLIEAVKQLRGEAGDRQVAGAKLAACQASGGVLSSQVTNILGTADCL
ncbi:MAG: thiolase [Ramlibacter sp.]|nr:thiolase [Ramlibacter sp.]